MKLTRIWLHAQRNPGNGLQKDILSVPSAFIDAKHAVRRGQESCQAETRCSSELTAVRGLSRSRSRRTDEQSCLIGKIDLKPSKFLRGIHSGTYGIRDSLRAEPRDGVPIFLRFHGNQGTIHPARESSQRLR